MEGRQQRAMTYIFEDLLHDAIDCYVDDLVVKTKLRQHHIADIDQVFQWLRRYNLKMNPLKCAFSLSLGWFLRFIIQHRGIEIDPKKITMIIKMPTPKNISELKKLQEKLAYICRFISNLLGHCQPFSRLTKKGVSFVWDQACQNAFDNIKQYLFNPPMLMSPTLGRPLLLYLVAMESFLGALLAQHNEEGKEHALYYLSKIMVGASWTILLLKRSV